MFGKIIVGASLFATCIVLQGCNTSSSSENAPTSEEASSPAPVSKDAYEKLKTGMTYDDVVKILGEPTTESVTEAAGIKMRVVSWIAIFGDKGIIVTFTNNKLDSKSLI